MVTLFGEVLARDKKKFIFSVASQLGDARNVGISGQISVPNNRAYGFGTDPKTGLVRIRIGYDLADLISKSCQQCE